MNPQHPQEHKSSSGKGSLEKKAKIYPTAPTCGQVVWDMTNVDFEGVDFRDSVESPRFDLQGISGAPSQLLGQC